MVWPIIRGKSYVGEAFKSMKAVGTAAAQKDGWRYIAITLIGRPIRKLPFSNAMDENQESGIERAFTRPVLGRISNTAA
jgi:hypothetical protein